MSWKLFWQIVLLMAIFLSLYLVVLFFQNYQMQAAADRMFHRNASAINSF